MANRVWTKEEIKVLLEKSTVAVERGIVRIFQLQTEDEQADKQTKHHNGVGFSGVDANFGTYLARWVMGGNHLDGKFLTKARHLTKKYAGQLVKIANGELNGVPC